jgi:hypothetical protein
MSGSQEGDSSKPTFYRRDSGARPGVHVPLAAWWNPVENKGQSKALWATKALGSELLKTAHYTLPFFAIAGLICNRRRLANPRTALLLITIAVHLSVLWLLAWKSDYVSQRHTLLSVMVISIFAPSSFPAIGGWLAKRWPSERVRRWTPWKAGGVLTLIVLASTLPRDFRSLHADRIGHKAAGQWLAKNGSNDIKVLDPFGWAEWYAGRTLHSPPPSAFALDGVYYFIFEPNAKSPHSRLNYFDYIRDRYERGLCELIYQYPEDAPPDKIKVGVYLSRPEPVKK